MTTRSERALECICLAYAYTELVACLCPLRSQFIDPLLVSNAALQEYGNLYLQAIADETNSLRSVLNRFDCGKPEHFVEPRLFWPSSSTIDGVHWDEQPPHITLNTLFGKVRLPIFLLA